MRPRSCAALVMLLALSAPSWSQEQTASTSPIPIALPKACQNATLEGKMQDRAMGGLEEDKARDMSAWNRALMETTMAMHGPMMQGASALNPDIAFTCAMIAHHHGAIAMAQIQLRYGQDEAAKRMAQDVIDMQTKEIAEMTKWVETTSGQ